MRSRALVSIITLVLLAMNVSVVAAAPAPVVSRGPSTDKVIALTFDDGYDPDACLKIYDTLVEYDIPATWFPNAVYMDAAPKLWKRIAARFPIANHTTHHQSLPSLSRKKIREEIQSQERRVLSITGRPIQKILRPPFGAYDDRVRREAGRLGYTSIALWDITSADTSKRAGDRAIAQRTLSGRPGSIILMHCGPPVTPRILPVVIARYACKGFRFATVADLLAGRRGVKAKASCPPPPLPERRNAKVSRNAGSKKPKGADASGYPTAPTQGEAVGQAFWHLSELRGDEALEPVPSDVVITLRFGSQTANGTIGCNVYSASATAKANGAIKLGRVRRSSDDCEIADAGWTTRYVESLAAVSSQRAVDEGLELLADDGQVVMRFIPGAPTSVLGEWTASAVADQTGELVTLVDAAPITASFGATGTLRGSTACTNFLSGYVTRDDAITIGPLQTTASTCLSEEGIATDGATAAEDFIAALSAASAWAIRDGILELRDATDRIVVEFESDPPTT